MRFSHEVALAAPAGVVNLPDWLFGLTEEDYAACAHAHLAIGMLGGESRTGMVNVESIGGTLVIQHYATRRAEPHRVTMVSKASRAYLMHLFPVTIGVEWDMQVIPAEQHGSRLRCTVTLSMSRSVWLLGQTIRSPWFVQRHLVEETIGFARNIACKVQERDDVRALAG